MPFFSSRKVEASPLPKSEAKSTVTVIKSKWYGKSRSKQAADPSNNTLEPPKAYPAFSDASSLRDMNNTLRGSPPTLSPNANHKADTVTQTLAQRLNELAVSNADGLLGDDEYRLLRQNLFERFGAAAQVPTEAQVVRMQGTENKRESRNVSGTVIDPKFRVNGANTASSIRSSNSRTSVVSAAMTGLFRRATGRRNASSNGSVSARDSDERMSIMSTSAQSRPSSTFQAPIAPRSLAYQTSNSSLRSSMSNQPHDLRSVASRRTAHSIYSNHTSASRGPPSAYHYRHATEPTQYDDTEKSAAELRAEIAAVEAEGKRVLDNFNGLELTVLTKHKGGGPTSSRASITGRLGDLSDSTWTLVPERSDASTSSGPIPPLSPSRTYPSRSQTVPSSNGSFMNKLSRKGSFTSVSSNSRPPPVPPIPATLPNSHRTSLHPPPARSTPHLPLSTQPQSPTTRSPPLPSSILRKRPSQVVVGDEDPIQDEMDLIRKSRTDTMAKYEDRLEYLKAKLKGAEIRERLIK